MPKLKAIRGLFGDYGRVEPGQTFETDDASAASLESRGLAERWQDPTLIQRLFKMTMPVENKALQPDENKGVAAPALRPPLQPIRREQQRQHGRR